MEHKRLTLFAGHYGSGKTNIAVNYALHLAAEGKQVCIADLDIDGTDLIALGFKPGRLLQDILCDLLEVVWNDPAKNIREELIKEALKRKD